MSTMGRDGGFKQDLVIWYIKCNKFICKLIILVSYSKLLDFNAFSIIEQQHYSAVVKSTGFGVSRACLNPGSTAYY